MTGPEHYRLAEEMLVMSDMDVWAGRVHELLAAAQVHATLAAAAATVDARGVVASVDEWRAVID
ncbi:hypothetical protein H0B56_12215 [Haloechinothrix sp. YIM 98757]|uniref:Uncharacterized protein n=1 Tax=Haloechinothrix aidingensis TaxID=2752311 RepID=A0A838AAQ5_9PSEU|nr:hypothetical protein [Haloechinothrix aidingensis]MBA0126307.1 hypothetical protein [Haloechinothrix aidingensis]